MEKKMYKQKISAVYQIINTVTGERYIGSSKDAKYRLATHRCPSHWKKQPNNRLYQDMQKYGLDKFEFLILASVEPERLRQTEQEFIEMLCPSYNNRRAKGQDIIKRNKTIKKYQTSGKGKEVARKASKKYRHSENGRKATNENNMKYLSRQCYYNGETLTLNALYQRLKKAGISSPLQEARKYLIQ